MECLLSAEKCDTNCDLVSILINEIRTNFDDLISRPVSSDFKLYIHCQACVYDYFIGFSACSKSVMFLYFSIAA